MKKIVSLICSLLIFFVAGAQDGSKTKNTANKPAAAGTNKSADNKKSPSSVTNPSGVSLPIYTPRTAPAPEPKKTLPKKNSGIK